MSSSESDFRDYGLHPDDAAAAPPRKQVSCYLSGGRVFGQWLSTFIIASLAVGLCAVFAMFLPTPIRWIALGTAMFTAVVGIGGVLRRSYSSVELDGDRLRIKHLYTGQVIERTIDEVERLTAIVMSSAHSSTAITNKLIGRFRGYDVRFRDGGTPLRITRADPAMTGAQELLEGVLQRLAKRGPLDVEVVDFEGRPYVKSIGRSDSDLSAQTVGNHVSHQAAKPNPKQTPYQVFAVLAAFFLGPMFAFWGAQEEEKFEIGKNPPHVVSVRELMQNGPGGNRYVTVTKFQIDGYVAEEKNGSWRSVTVALYPDDVPLAQLGAIPVVLTVKTIDDEAELVALLDLNRVTGICSVAPRTNWGLTLGPQLIESNGNRTLTAAWDIDEMNSPPSEGFVTGLYVAAYVTFATALVLTIVALLRR